MVKLGSLTVSPTILNASCAWASDLSQLQALFDSPYTGAVVTRTSTLEGFEEGASHTVRFTATSTSTLNSYGYSPHKLSQYLSWIETILDNAPPTSPKPFLVSISASDDVEMRGVIRAIQDLRAKAPPFARIGIEFNTSCPNIRGHAPTGYALSSVASLLGVLRDAYLADRTLTIGLKLPPYVYAGQFTEVVQALRDLGAPSAASPIAYIACTNTLGSSLLFAEQVDGAGGEGFAVPTVLGGLAGDALHPLALGNVHSFAQLLRTESVDSPLRDLLIVGLGGVTSAAAAQRMRNAGASLVASATLFGKEGVDAFRIIGNDQEKVD